MCARLRGHILGAVPPSLRSSGRLRLARVRSRPLARPCYRFHDLTVQTRPGICQKKRRFDTRETAEAVALQADVTLRAYKCALCKKFHLTSRTKGLRVPRLAREG